MLKNLMASDCSIIIPEPISIALNKLYGIRHVSKILCLLYNQSLDFCNDIRIEINAKLNLGLIHFQARMHYL